VKLALFDLDHTLLPIDSADTWSHHLVRAAGLDGDAYGARIRHFSTSYRDGTFDVEDYLRFQFGLLAKFPRPQLELWRADFLRLHVLPQIRAEALMLIHSHRVDGYELALVTGTNAFVATPIAAALGLPHTLAAQPEENAGEFTGGYRGTHTYQEGKLRAVRAFLAARDLTLEQCEDSVFYSDSINDLPLLEKVRRPVVTNGDAQLCRVARERQWPMIDLFATRAAA